MCDGWGIKSEVGNGFSGKAIVIIMLLANRLVGCPLCGFLYQGFKIAQFPVPKNIYKHRVVWLRTVNECRHQNYIHLELRACVLLLVIIGQW